MPSRNDESTDIGIQILDRPSQDVVAVILDIYEEAIPAAERRSTEALIGTFASPRCRLLIARRTESVVGFAVLYRGVALALLEYVAVHRNFRSHGVGSQLCKAAKAASGALPLIVEVDADDAPAADLDIRVRRKSFYRRHGFRELQGLKYILPLPGANPAEHLHLLVSGAPLQAVPLESVEAWLTEIYTTVYGTAPDDPRLAAMLSGAGPSVGLA